MIITNQQKKFIGKHWAGMTNRELADAMGLGLTSCRTMCYQLGYKRMELEYWTDEQVKLLKQYYGTRGDKELATMFNERWYKEKGWTLKHIEKKRKYLGLKRTARQIEMIKLREIRKGTYIAASVKTWDTRGRMEEGQVRYWDLNKDGKLVAAIKINGKVIHYNRYLWEKHRGKIPKGYNVLFKNKDRKNPYRISNLELVSDSNLGRRNYQKGIGLCSDRYVAGRLAGGDRELKELLLQHPQLLEIKRQQLFLNRQINKHEQTATAPRKHGK